MYAQYWSVAKPIVDAAMSYMFLSFKNLKPLFFIRGKLPLLALYASMEDLQHVIGCLESQPEHDPDPSTLSRVLCSCGTLKLSLCHLQKRMHYTLYVDEIEKQLKQLEHNHFIPSEVAAAKGIMQREARSVSKEVFKDFQKKGLIHAFLGGVVRPSLTCADDEHLFRFSARVKSCALNSGQLTQFPWEKALFAPGQLADVPQTIQIPDAELTKTRNCREAFASYAGSALLTLVEDKRVFAASLNALRDLDRTCSLEKYHLDHCVEDLLIQKLQGDVLAVLPDERGTSSFKQVSRCMKSNACEGDMRTYVL